MHPNAYQTVKAYFDALIAGDADRIISLMSTADYYVKIGTAPDEHIEGAAKSAAYYREITASASDFSIEHQHLDVQERGAVAWFYTRQIWRLRWKGVAEELPIRITGVLEKQEAVWKFVQIHASVGVQE